MNRTGLLGHDPQYPNLCDIPHGCDELYFNTTATSVEHVELARSLAAESIVMLKNDGELLPLNSDVSRVAVVGSACDASNHIQAMLKVWNLGNYYVMGGSGRVIPSDPVSVIRGIKVSAPDSMEIVESLTDDLNRALEAMDGADVVITCGATTSTEGQDRSSLLVDQDNFIRSVVEQAKMPSVVVLMTPGASVISNFSPKSSAVLNGFLLGQETGTAFADIIFGAVTPSGKLPVTFALSSEDYVEPCQSNPCEYSEKLEVGWRGLVNSDVDFPFGHGMSFTTFSYSFSDEPQLLSNGDVTLSVEVANTGKFSGAEVAQVYVNFPDSAGEPLQMKAFSKTPVLLPDQVEVINFTLSAKDLQVWSVKDSTWTSVTGDFGVFVGASSRDMRLKTSVTL